MRLSVILALGEGEKREGWEEENYRLNPTFKTSSVGKLINPVSKHFSRFSAKNLSNFFVFLLNILLE